MVPEFAKAVMATGELPVSFNVLKTLQVNVGNMCNQRCKHCHVDASPLGPKMMSRQVIDGIIDILRDRPGLILDITGGCPEMNPSLVPLVEGSHDLVSRLMVRTNLTVLVEEGNGWLPAWYRDNGVVLIASLPCYTPENVDKQRGPGVFKKSIEALRLLNSLGYGESLELDLVYNASGASLPPCQPHLEMDYRRELEPYGVKFTSLFTITNVPLGRFGHSLTTNNELEPYLRLLADNFNPGTLPGLMCRTQVSVDWQGVLYDCDFNQAAGVPIRSDSGVLLTLRDLEAAIRRGRDRPGRPLLLLHCRAGVKLHGCPDMSDPREGEGGRVFSARDALTKLGGSCTGCGSCLADCNLLRDLGMTPLEISAGLLEPTVVSKIVDFVLRCDLCGRCSAGCVEQMDIPAMVMAARSHVAATGIVDPEIYRPMWIDYDWNSFTIYRDTYQVDYGDRTEGPCHTLFFPGCVLGSYAPELTRSALGWLSTGGEKTGLTLMCCGTPLEQIGEHERAAGYESTLWKTVAERGAARVVTACPTCQKRLVQQAASRGVEVVSLYELMADSGLRAQTDAGRLTIHDSCSARHGDLGRQVRRLLPAGQLVEMRHSGESTVCCGSGGIVSAVDRPLCAARSAARSAEISETGADLCVTYCLSCSRSLSRVPGGKRARHILELLLGTGVDYEAIQGRVEAMWEGQWGEYNRHRLDNSQLLGRHDG